MSVDLVLDAWMSWGRWTAAGLVWAGFGWLIVSTALDAGKGGKRGF